MYTLIYIYTHNIWTYLLSSFMWVEAITLRLEKSFGSGAWDVEEGDGPKYLQGTNIAPERGTFFLKGIASSNHPFFSMGRDGSFRESPPKINA